MYTITVVKNSDSSTFFFENEHDAESMLTQLLSDAAADTDDVAVTVRFDVEYCSNCTHAEKFHVGYVAGPVVREWCEGSGSVDDAPKCKCIEFEGGIER